MCIRDREYAEPKSTEKWLAKIAAWDAENPLEMRRDKGMSPQMIMESINEVFPKGIVVTDVGQHQMWATQYIDMPAGKKMITSGGLGTMGFGFPAAIGAKLGAPEQDVVCITRDGGMQMNMQELATAFCEKVPVTVCILNNYYLGMVRQMQQLFYGKRYEITCLRRNIDCPDNCKGPNKACPPYVPDFVKWAESYGAKAMRVTEESQIQQALMEAKANTETTTVLEFRIATDELVLPMVKSGTPMS